MSSRINGNWFSVSEDKEVEFLNLNEDEKEDKKIDKRFKDLEDKLNRIYELEERVKELETTCHKIRNENLKLINRVLEAEISIERTKNILLRKNISFPFTPLTTKFL